jgi:hypothetical protein
MTSDIKHYSLGAIISFLGTVGICILIHPNIFHYYGYGVSEFGAIHDTLVPFFLGFAATILFLALIALRLRSTAKALSLIFLLAASCLAGIAITSYPFNGFTYDLHWCFVILLTLVIVTGIIWRFRVS